MKVTVNGETRKLPDSLSLKDAVGKLVKNPEGVVAELNRAVIRKANWRKKQLKDGDVLELIAIMGGG